MTQRTIVQSVRSVFRNADIAKLSLEAYRFITLKMSFIAHYDVHGFRATYADLRHFARTLQTSEYSRDTSHMLDWADELQRRGELENAETIKQIVELAREYEPDMAIIFAERQQEAELAEARRLAERNGFVLVQAVHEWPRTGSACRHGVPRDGTPAQAAHFDRCPILATIKVGAE